jgi:hypothetical protein
MTKIRTITIKTTIIMIRPIMMLMVKMITSTIRPKNNNLIMMKFKNGRKAKMLLPSKKKLIDKSSKAFMRAMMIIQHPWYPSRIMETICLIWILELIWAQTIKPITIRIRMSFSILQHLLKTIHSSNPTI